jgi:hypothetical protein
MSDASMNERAPEGGGLVGAKTCLSIVFPDEQTRPSLRFFRKLQRMGKVPFKKIGRLTFFDPAEVRRAFDTQFGKNGR